MAIKQEERDQIAHAFNYGKLRKAKELLEKVLKRGKFSDKERADIAYWQQGLNQFGRAIKTLGPELSEDELMTATHDEVLIQMRLAYILIRNSATKTGFRIQKKIEKVLKAREVDPLKIEPRYYLHYFNLYRYSGQSNYAAEYGEKALEVYPEDHKYNHYVKCFLGIVYHNLGNYQRAHELVNLAIEQVSDEIPLLKARCHMAKGELFLRENKFDEAKTEIEEARKTFYNMKDTHEYSVLTRMQGLLCVKTGNIEKGLDYLDKCIASVQNNHGSQAIEKGVLYAKYIYKLEDFRIDQKVGLFCHPAFPSMSFQFGRKYIEEIHKKYFRDNIPDNQDEFKNNDCWIIHNDDIKAGCYQEMIKNVINTSKGRDLVDLKSGIFFKDQKIFKTIPENQIKFLTSIIKAGSLGINKWSVIDDVYEQEIFSFSYGEERIKNLISDIRKLGFKITRRKNNFFFEFDENTSYILPTEEASLEHFHFVKCMIGEQFKTRQVIELFGVHKTTASRWVKSWLENNIVKKEGQSYRFAS